MTSGVILRKHWECAKGCGSHATTVDGALPHHPCKKMAGLMVALIPVGTRAKVEAMPREDYVGSDLVTRDADGKVWMSTVVTRDDGSNDTTVYAPCATAKIERA